MTRFSEEYAEAFSAAAINASAQQIFGAAESSSVNRLRYGSANSLVLSSIADENFAVDLDGLTTRRLGILQPKGSFVIKPEDGVFFNTVRLVNLDGTNSSADEVKVRIARAKQVA